MVDSPIASVSLYRVSLPTRREHKWTGLTEPIGGYVIVKIADENGLAGWGEAPGLKDWGGGVRRFFGGNPRTARSKIGRASCKGKEEISGVAGLLKKKIAR